MALEKAAAEAEQTELVATSASLLLDKEELKGSIEKTATAIVRLGCGGVFFFFLFLLSQPRSLHPSSSSSSSSQASWQQELVRIDTEIAAKEEALQTLQPNLDSAIATHHTLEEQLKAANLRQRFAPCRRGHAR